MEPWSRPSARGGVREVLPFFTQLYAFVEFARFEALQPVGCVWCPLMVFKTSTEFPDISPPLPVFSALELFRYARGA